MYFLVFFSEFSCPGREYERNLGLNFFFPFLGLYHPVFAKNNAGNRYFNFWIFLLFFSEFSSSGRVWTEFGTKIFLFLGLYYSILAKNNAGNRFFNFFCYFFRNFLARVEYERNLGLKFFSLFLGQYHPVLAKNNGRNRFFNFLNFFCYFFWNFQGRVG